MMMLDERLFDQEWIQELPPDARWLYLYILAKASRKTGIIELNMRMLNFGAATSRAYTKEDVMSMFGGRVQMVPGHGNTAIVVDYIQTNWCKRGGSVDDTRSPLYRSIANELARYGLTMEAVEEMAGRKTAPSIPAAANAKGETKKHGGMETCRRTAAEEGSEIQEAFERFWKEYPGPRKTDKRKCLDLFASAARGAVAKGEALGDFEKRVVAGVERWKATDDWRKDGGRFICAPAVWLRNQRWEAEVQALKGGTANGNINGGRGRSTNANYQDADEAAGILG